VYSLDFKQVFRAGIRLTHQRGSDSEKEQLTRNPSTAPTEDQSSKQAGTAQAESTQLWTDD